VRILLTEQRECDIVRPAWQHAELGDTMPYKSIEMQKANKRKYYLKNRKRFLAARRKYRAKNHEQVLECQRKCYRKNAHAIKEYQKTYYAKNRDYVNARNRAYTSNHRDEIRRWNKKRVKENMFYHARQRAKRNGIIFTLSLDDFEIPVKCPILGIRLKAGKRMPHAFSPTLDRVIPKLGYIKGNVQVISHRANRLKGDASLKELKLLVSYVRRLTKTQG
jgi:hypothetical protein